MIDGSPERAMDRPPLKTALLILLLALAYAVSGWLGLHLAVAPGFATALWPASGIALASLVVLGRTLWPGVLLGSLLINLPIQFAAGGMSLTSVLVALAVACGACLQALIGARLATTWAPRQDLLDLEPRAVSLLLLSAPLACLVSTTLATTTLGLADRLNGYGPGLNWVTWWVGDSLGVLVFAPLALMWLQPAWTGGRRERLWVSLPLLGTLAAVLTLALLVGQREDERLRGHFDRWCDGYLLNLQSDVEDKVTALHALRALFEGQEQVSRNRFDAVASALIARRPGLRSLSWSPRLEAGSEQDFVRAGQEDYGPSFALLPLAPGQRVNESFGRVPLRYITPLLGNSPALGLDLAADPVAARALSRASDAGSEAATGLLTLMQDPSHEPALLIVLPVYAPRSGARREVAGFVMAAMHAGDAMLPAVRDLESRGVHLRLLDPGDGEAQVLYQTTPQAPGTGFRRTESLTVAGRSWRTELVWPATEQQAYRSREPWLVLSLGMLFTAALGAVLLLLLGRSRQAEAQVARRGAELRLANEALSRQLEGGENQRHDSQMRTEELVALNRELEQFAYIVSHDLAAPLRSVGNFAQLLEKKSASLLDERSREFLSLIREGVGEMQRLMDALLRMSRITRDRMTIGLVDSRHLMARTQEILRSEIETQQAEISVDDLPRVYGDEELLLQLFQQLVSNALRFRRPEAAPRIRVTAQTRDSEWEFSVIDNGTGLPPQNLPRLFQVFRRFHPASQYPGTGIGLALSRKIVRLHGGRIWAESTEGLGSSFHFTLPFDAQRMITPDAA